MDCYQRANRVGCLTRFALFVPSAIAFLAQTFCKGLHLFSLENLLSRFSYLGLRFGLGCHGEEDEHLELKSATQPKVITHKSTDLMINDMITCNKMC